MTVDDVNDKLRRNVVVLSFLILLSVVFPLEWSADAKVFGLFGLKNPEPRALWITVMFVLGYCYYRYFCDEKAQIRRAETRKEHRELKEALILFKLQSQVSRVLLKRVKSVSLARQSVQETIPYSHSLADKLCLWMQVSSVKKLQPQSHCQILNAQLDESIQYGLETAPLETEVQNLAALRTLIDKNSAAKDSWGGKFIFNIELIFEDGNDNFSLTDGEARFVILNPIFWSLVIRARWLLFSKPMIDVFIVDYLAAVAGLVLLLRVLH